MKCSSLRSCLATTVHGSARQRQSAFASAVGGVTRESFAQRAIPEPRRYRFSKQESRSNCREPAQEEDIKRLSTTMILATFISIVLFAYAPCQAQTQPGDRPASNSQSKSLWEGTWETNFGGIVVMSAGPGNTIQGKANWNGGGQFVGTVEGNRMVGYCSQPEATSDSERGPQSQGFWRQRMHWRHVGIAPAFRRGPESV